MLRIMQVLNCADWLETINQCLSLHAWEAKASRQINNVPGRPSYNPRIRQSNSLKDPDDPFCFSLRILGV